MVIDQLNAKRGTTLFPTDSFDGKIGDIINVEDKTFHFAKQKDLTGTSEIIADNGVAEPIISLGVAGNTRQEILPDEYQQVEYIESSGTQYINTGVKPNEKIRVDAKFQALQNKGSFIFGARIVTVTPVLFTVNISSGGEFTWGYGTNGYGTPYAVFDTNIHTASLYNKKLIFDGKTITSSSVTSNSFTVDYPIYIFACNQSGTAYLPSYTRVYSFKIKDGDTLIRDLIPCYRVSDEVLGMFDLVNSKFYTNAGTGKFIKGANASPTPDLPIPIENANSNRMSVSLNDMEISIPASLVIDGTTVPLIFSEYDRLTVDRVKNKVVYSQGSLYKEFENGNQFTIHNWASQNGYGNNYIWQKYYHNTEILNNGYCNYFSKVPMNWDTMSKQENVFALYNYDNYIVFRTNGTMTTTEFREWVVEKYNEGNPLTILVQRATPLEHDITNTELGQNLLALATSKGTNYLEISSNLAPSQTDLSYWRQIIPNE